MAWVESHQSLSRHRKTLDVVDALKVDRHRLIGHLHELWWWGLDNADAQGHVGHVSEKQLADAAGWPRRDARRFVVALLESGRGGPGFLESDSSGYILHDWEDYAGKYNDQKQLRRASNRAAQRRRRQQVVSSTNDDSQHHVSADRQHTNDDSQHSTGPNQPDLPPVGPLNASSPARARPPDVAPPRGPRPSNGETTTTDARAPTPLPNGAQQCPTCPQVFTGTYADHLEQAATHKIRATPEDFSSPSPQPRRKRGVLDVAAEVAAELDQLARAKAERGPVALDQALVAEHEAILARSRQRKSSLEDA